MHSDSVYKYKHFDSRTKYWYYYFNNDYSTQSSNNTSSSAHCDTVWQSYGVWTIVQLRHLWVATKVITLHKWAIILLWRCGRYGFVFWVFLLDFSTLPMKLFLFTIRYKGGNMDPEYGVCHLHDQNICFRGLEVK